MKMNPLPMYCKRTFFPWLLCLLFLNTVCAQTGWFIPSSRLSSGIINDICQDKQGYVWVATDYGLNQFDGYRFTTSLHQPSDSTSLSSNIVGCLYCDRDGNLWVGTARGLDRYDPKMGAFAHYLCTDGAKPRVTKICQLNDGRLYVGTSGYHGSYVLSGDSLEHWDEADTSMNFINSILCDRQGRFWQCSFGNEFSMKDHRGLHHLSSTLGFVIDFVQRPNDEEVLIICLHGIHSYRNGELVNSDFDMSEMTPGAIVRSVCADQQGNIYLGTRGDGLFCIPYDSRKLQRVEVLTEGFNLNTARVWAVAKDRIGNLWVGCQAKGLLMLQKHPSQFHAWNFAPQGYDISSSMTSMCEGENGMTWCAVQGNGVFGFDSLGHVVAHPSAPASAECIYRHKSDYYLGTDNTLYAYSPQTGKAERLFSYDCDKFNSIYDDGKGKIYVSAFSRGLLIYDKNTKKLRNLNSRMKDERLGWLCNNWIMSMMPDRDGRLWMATSSGVSCYDPVTDSFRPEGWHQLLGSVLCFTLCQTRSGDILIGTESGLYVYHKGDNEARPFADILHDKVVGNIVEAENGDIWCSTSMGIWQYDKDKQRWIGHVNGNGLTVKEYTNSVGLHTSDGRVLFAHNAGLTMFRPKEVTGSHTSMPDVTLTNFLIAGKAVPCADQDRFVVSYLDNVLSLEFSLLDYNHPANIVYEYRIGDSEWMQNEEGQNSIQLSRLQPGTYQIEVRALASGLSSNTKTITIEVTPPWYRSTVAYLIYLFVIVLLLLSVGWLLRRRARMVLDEEKMRFLINATHDIRSPLTLIMGGVEKLKNSKVEELKTESDVQSFNTSVLQPSVQAIDRNAQRLMLLVNQILDERRIDKDQMQLHCRETNLVEFISGICKLYQFSASQRNITFTFEHEKDHVLAWIDRINFDKVISNLLSNAFKYTYDGGEVKVVLSEHEKDIEVRVEDNGVGLRNEDLSRLFDRFYQGRNADSLGMQGTGIGLNLSRNIVKMHGGEIAASNLQPGACFTVTLPKGNKHLKAEQIVTDSPAREVLSTGDKQSFRQFRILIVDDDAEIARYIVSELGSKYRFDHSPNGKEALKTLLTTDYDLVISDVMMPEMDGITLLKHIKGNPTISHLPVIMLTSKAAVSNKLEGLKSGADAYIPKPFNMEELHIQIDNLIDSMRRLKGKFSGALKQEERVENIEVTDHNDKLMDRIMRSVNAHMQEPDYNVDALAEDVGISRAQLHRKMKEITGVSSGKFLRNLRMEQAARLLRTHDVNIAQVAFRVGFNDQAYFATAFKAHFGVTPTEYAENHKND